MKTRFKDVEKMAVLLCISVWSLVGFSQTIYVPVDYATIQEALDAANTGDEVIVASGTYYENIIWPATDGITLSGSGEESCFIDGSEIASVIRFEEDLGGIITNATTIKDFTIQNGFAQGGGDQSNGGGICMIDASPSFENLTISNNKANYGGGVNSLTWTIHYYTPYFNNVKVIGNESEGYGGGMRFSRTDPTITNSIISDNISHSSGGGIQSWIDSDITLSNVTISNNKAIVDGSAAGHGGGIECFPEVKLFLTNVVITDNSATWTGGGIRYTNYHTNESTFTNVTISNNTATYGGGIWLAIGDYGIDNYLNIINCILWDNSPNEVEFDDYNAPSNLRVNYCDIKGGQAGIQTNGNGTLYWEEGNINEDPLFCNPEVFEYHLFENSPCAGTGQNGVDMGALPVGCTTVSIDEMNNEFASLSNFPNPFNSSTTITFDLQENEMTILTVHDITGSVVETLINEIKNAGSYSVVWNAKNYPSGLYFYSLKTDKKAITKKMSLVK